MDQARWIVDRDGVNPTLNEDGSLNLYCPKRIVIRPGYLYDAVTRLSFLFPVGTKGLVRPPPGQQQFETLPSICDEYCCSIKLRNSSDREVEIQPGQVMGQVVLIDSTDDSPEWGTVEDKWHSTDEESDSDLDDPGAFVKEDPLGKPDTMALARWIVDDGLNPTLREDGSLDLYSPIHVRPGHKSVVDTGVRFLFPFGKKGVVRSPAAGFKTNFATVDWSLGVFTVRSNTVEIQRGDVVAQMVMVDRAYRDPYDSDSDSDSDSVVLKKRLKTNFPTD